MNREKLENFAAIEGTDYTGKETNVRLTEERLIKLGRTVLTMAFPRYELYSGRMVRSYLNGEFGETLGVHPKLAGYLYEVDRALAGDDIREFVASGGDVLADRFFGSNLGHQGAKIGDKDQRRAFYEACMVSEFDELNVPIPVQSFVLLVSKSFMKATIEERIARGDDLDGHERDIPYQMHVIETFEEVCEVYPELFTPIDCMKTETKRFSIEEINDKLFEEVMEVL